MRKWAKSWESMLKHNRKGFISLKVKKVLESALEAELS